jgi:ComF family protein
MAIRMSRLSFPADVVDERSAVVPVPLSRERLRDRGFNQCEIIARKVAARWEIECSSDALRRSESARSQTRLTPEERLSNVAGAFSVPDSARDAVRGRHLILLDDVVTTGATLRSCASALFAAGARTLSYMTFGRAPASGDRIIQQENTKWQ